MDDEFDLKFVPELDIFDVVPDDDIFILEPVPIKEPKRIIKNKTEVRVPVYAKKKFNSNPTRINRFITAPVPEFVADRENFQKEIDYRNINYQIFQRYMLDFVKEKFRRETKSIKDSMAMPHIALQTIFYNNNIQRSTFKIKTLMSDATYDRIMKRSDYVPDLKTLTNICWTFKIDYLVAEGLFRSYGINLDAKTTRIRAYKHVLKYMLFVDIDTVNQFLKENKVPYFRKNL